jgi:hypothetical protein
MEQGVPRIPTVAETIRLHANSLNPGGLSGWRSLALSVAGLVVLALVLPPIPLDKAPILPFSAAVLGPTLGSAHREYRYGGSALLILVAAVTTASISTVAVVAFFALSSIVGGTLSFPILGGFSADFLVAFLLGLAVLLVVLYFVTKGRRERASRAFEDDVRAERTRRGFPTAP